MAKNAILEELEACKRGQITETELETARNQIISSLKMSMDAPARLDDFYIGMAVSDGLDIPQLMEEVKLLTVEDVSAVAKKLSLDTIYFLKGEEA